MPGTNTVAYFALLTVTKKKKVYNIDHRMASGLVPAIRAGKVTTVGNRRSKIVSTKSTTTEVDRYSLNLTVPSCFKNSDFSYFLQAAGRVLTLNLKG